MKMQGFWKGMRAILCGVLVIACVAMGGLQVLAAGYTSDNHPRAVYSPDGTGWTIIDELPYYEEYDFREYKKTNPGEKYSFWSEDGVEYETGLAWNLPNPGVGQHEYSYDRSGMTPVYKWVVEHAGANCIHRGQFNELGGLENLRGDICYNAYWSGLMPICADCGQRIIYALHYIKPESAKELQYINMDKHYYYICPHHDNHTDGFHMEQGAPLTTHECRAVSYNQYKVVYNKNAPAAIGSMAPSYHMYNNATMYRGREVEPNKYLSLNRFKYAGYVFDSWNTKPDGTGQRFIDGQEIYNLTAENYDEELSMTDGVVTLYAQWKRHLSDLKIDAKGGKYEDGIGVVNGDKTTYDNYPYGYELELDAENVTPPKGYKVSFVTNCAETIAPMWSQKVFKSWKKGTPFNGRFINDTFSFFGGHNTLSVIEVLYRNGSIELPSCNNGDEVLVGWYKDAACTQIVGTPGSYYTPDADITLYAKWEKDLVLYAVNDLTVDSYKGGVDLSWEASGGTNKVFKLYQKLKESAEYSPLVTADNGGALTVNKEFVFSGTIKEYTVPYTGFYTFEAYGAQGGSYGDYVGGKGGYATGKFWLKEGDVLRIAVGGSNGFNGGGNASMYGKGGGFTKVTNKTRNEVLLIAGGGGGASATSDGGDGGAETSLVASGSTGASGTSGGGGGYRGGSGGDELKHDHGPECEVNHLQHTEDCYDEKTHWHDADVCDWHYVEYCGRDDGWRHGKPGWCPNCNKYEDGECNTDNRWRHPASGNWCCVKKTEWDCGYENGQIITERTCGYEIGDLEYYDCKYADKESGYVYDYLGAYGGSSYVNSEKAVASDMKSGRREGDGLLKITANGLGFQVAFAMDNVSANDLAKPDKVDINTVTYTQDGVGALLLGWAKPEDHGTTYNHWAQSFDILNGDHLCDSNETENTITTGVYSYYYIYDSSATKTVTKSNKHGTITTIDANGRSKARVEVPGSGNYYFHVAAVDRAGNVGPTLDILVQSADDPSPFAWGVFTKQVEISSNVGGHEYNNIYHKEDKTYYVRADNATPFKLYYDSALSGNASNNYQIDNLLFNVSCEGAEQIYETVVAHTSKNEVGSVVATITGRSVTGEGSFLRDAMKSYVERKRKAIDVRFCQCFKIPASQNGKILTVVPVAGASYTAEDGFEDIKYSEWSDDITHGIKLIPDAEPPIFAGADTLGTMTDVSRQNGTTVTITASDLLSGVRDFKVIVNNIDNHCSHTYLPNAEGKVVITFNNANALFYGNLSIELEAVDNVGNVNSITYGADELGLTATVKKTVPDGRTTYAKGEGALLDFVTTGYAEYVEIDWPEGFDSSLPTRFDYRGYEEYAKPEYVPFIIPRADAAEYSIVVRAYKNGMMKQETVTLQVYGEKSGRVRIR